MRDIEITDAQAKQRLDKFLRKYFREAKSSLLYKSLRKKNILLNEKKASGAEILKAGDRVRVYFREETFTKLRGVGHTQSLYEKISSYPHSHVSVVYEDSDILAVNKPANMLSQQSRAGEITMNEEILSYLIAEGALSQEQFALFRPSVANRLDRNTTGLLLAGKSLRGQQRLSEVLRERSTRKYYRAIVLGQMREEMTLDAYLYKDEDSNRVRIAEERSQLPEGAKRIRTAYRPLDRRGSLTLLEIHLITGKSHQIRAHLAYLGYPILGDPKYGDSRANQILAGHFGVCHQLLHAYSLVLGEGREIVCPPNEIFEKILSSGIAFA